MELLVRNFVVNHLSLQYFMHYITRTRNRNSDKFDLPKNYYQVLWLNIKQNQVILKIQTTPNQI